MIGPPVNHIGFEALGWYYYKFADSSANISAIIHFSEAVQNQDQENLSSLPIDNNGQKQATILLSIL